MIRVTVEIKDRAVSRQVRITAPSIERALRMAGQGSPGREVRIVFPIDPEDFFAGSGTPAGMAPLHAGFEAA